MAKKSKKRSKGGSSNVAVIDFGKAEEGGGGRRRYPEADYIGIIRKAVMDKSSEKESKCIRIELEIEEPDKYAGKKITERLWLSPKALPRLMDMLELLGIKVPKKAVKIPLNKLKGKRIGFSLEDEEYEGKIRSRVSWDFLDPDDVDPDAEPEDDEDDDDLDLDDEDEDEEEEDEDEDDDDDEDEDDLDDMDRSELKAHIKEEGLDVKVKKSMDDDDIREAIRAEEDEDDDEDDEDELDELDLDEL